MSNENQYFAAFEPTAEEAAMKTSANYDSGWRQANSHSNNTVAFDHSLGVIPSQITILFSADKITAYPLTWSWEPSKSGNPVTISMTDQLLDLQIYGGAPLHGAWAASTATWTQWTQGYLRILAWK